MSKTKTGGRTMQKPPRAGKRLGVKIFGDQRVKTGQIIIRQRGSKFHAGEGVGRGRDFTLYALKDGLVAFGKRQGKKIIRVQ